MSQPIYHHATDDPFVATEAAEGKLYEQIHGPLSRLATESWPALQARTTEAVLALNGATNQIDVLRREVAEKRADPAAWKAAAAAAAPQIATIASAARAKVDNLHKDIKAVQDILRAEVVVKSRPQVNPEREHFVRQDLAAMLDASSDPLRTMVDVAAGAHRDRAAVVAGDFSDAWLQKIPDKSTRRRLKEGLDAALLQGSLAHGTAAEREAAKAVREILPKVAGWVSTRTVPAMARLKDAEATRP